MTTIITCTAAFACATLIYIAARYLCKARSLSLLPPGPPGLPWLGNVIGIDMNAPWVTYHEWAKTYGDIIHSRILGQDIIIIHSENTAKDLLDKHSSNNSGRPHIITSDLCGLDFNSVLLPYGDRWRLHRRFFHQTFRMNAVQRFIPFHHRRACQLLRQLFSTPEHLDEHVFEYTSAIILNSTYDHDVRSGDDELIKSVAKVKEIAISLVRIEIAVIIAAFPMLLKLPEWLPGMSFKKEMALASKLTRGYVEMAFEGSLQKMRESGSTSPSMVQDGMQRIADKGIGPGESVMNELKGAAATAFLAASETVRVNIEKSSASSASLMTLPSKQSHAFLMSFFLMMMLNPATQERAQAQIDDVVGKDRLPMMEDRPSLPFIDAIYRETFRFSPVAPLTIPHAAVDDDVYRGYHIPKGSIFFVNVWSIAHDESRYQNPHAFVPERFLNDDGTLKPNDIENIAYGYGRRMCVGKYFADASVWALMAKVLAVFKILKPLDENGAEITVEPKYSGGLAVCPVPFKFRIVPRLPGMDAEKLEELIAASTL